MEAASTETLGFERVPISLRRVGQELAARLADNPENTVLVVDMGWGLKTASATANFEGWTGVAHDLAAATGRTVVSLYNRSLLIDEHLIAALRGHPAVLAAEGVVGNPHWLPPQLQEKGTLREQVNFWLGGLAPSLAQENPFAARHAAKGVGRKFAAERGLGWRPAVTGEAVSGRIVGQARLASGRFAMIEDGLGFSLVPWNDVLERRLGQTVSGTPMPGGGFNWTFGRNLGLGL